MARYTPYPQYTPEGIPLSWQKKRLRFALKMNPSKSEMQLKDSDVVSFVPMDAVGEYGGIRLSEEKALAEIGSGYTYFCDDDVVVAKITPCFENGKAAIAKGLTNKTAFGTTELHVLRAESGQLESNFLFYLTISDLFQKLGESEMYGAGGQKRVPETFFKDFRASLPPIEEQQTIARFLDFKTAQIDALIAKQKTLLDKLAEKRTALISHAVTKGLNPTAAMKDSGVAWLGAIPVHWIPKRLRFCMTTNPSKSEIPLEDTDLISFIPMEAVGEFGGLNLDTEKELGEIGSGYTYFADGDVVVAKITPCFENGKGAIARGLKNGIAFGTTELHVMRSGESILPDYLFHLTMSHPFMCIGESEMYGAGGQKRVPETFLKDFRIGLPPLNEQRAIVDRIHKINRMLDQQMLKMTDAINRLAEYRAALITNAVTGKIDVRHWQ
jgi:restriction endonuclease S subunit